MALSPEDLEQIVEALKKSGTPLPEPAPELVPVKHLTLKEILAVLVDDVSTTGPTRDFLHASVNALPEYEEDDDDAQPPVAVAAPAEGA